MADIGRRYKAGEMGTSEVKKELVNVLQDLVRKHQEARKRVTEEEIDYFMSTAKFGGSREGGYTSKKKKAAAAPVASGASSTQKQAEVQSYLDSHNIQGMVQAALENLAKEMPPDPRAFLAQTFQRK